MRGLISILSIPLLFSINSCTTDKEAKDANQNNDNQPKPEQVVVPKLTDTLEQNGFKYIIQSLKPKQISSIKTFPNLDEIEKIKIKCPNGKDNCPEEIEKVRINRLQDTGLIKRAGEELKLRLKDSSYTTITSNIQTEGDDYAAYYFVRYIADAGLFILNAHYYEGGEMILINANNGEKISIEGAYPVFSPDRSKFIITSSLFSIGEPDAITIFQIEDNSYKIILTYSKGWGALDARWIDNSSLIMEQEIVPEDPTKENSKNKNYCKLIITKDE